MALLDRCSDRVSGSSNQCIDYQSAPSMGENSSKGDGWQAPENLPIRRSHSSPTLVRMARLLESPDHGSQATRAQPANPHESMEHADRFHEYLCQRDVSCRSLLRLHSMGWPTTSD